MDAEQFDAFLSGGNGSFTLTSRATGKEYRYRTKTEGQTWRRGHRIAPVWWERGKGWQPLLVGTLILNDDGRWWMNAEQDLDWMFENGDEYYAAREALVFAITQRPKGRLHPQLDVTATTCRRCGRELTDPRSIARGYGPECAHHMEEGT